MLKNLFNSKKIYLFASSNKNYQDMKKKKSLYDALTQGVIASIFKDIDNNSVFCYTELGSFFGAYSLSYYRKVYNSLDMPIPLKVLNNVLD